MFKKLANFLNELNVLKRMPRTGSFVAGIKHPDSVAEHAFRAAELAIILAELEGVDRDRALRMTLIHDNAETRIGDLNKIMARYFKNKNEVEMAAFKDQCQNLPAAIARDFIELFEEYEAQKTPVAKVAKDADLLELAFQAKEFLDIGYQAKSEWIDNVEKNLKTKSGKALFAAMKKTRLNEWWEGLK